MLSIDHSETPYDLRFRVGSTPVRVHPFFWLTVAFLGWNWFNQKGGGIGYLILWVACCFISVLLHELGHVWMGMLFGTRGHIVLWSFGGVAIGSNQLAERWKRIAVSLAGPGIQLLFFGVLQLSHLWILDHIAPDWSDRVYVFLFMLLMINKYWALLNLLPIWPLDGGMIARELCTAASPQKGGETSLLISIGVSGILAIHCLMAYYDKPLVPSLDWLGGIYMTLFFALFCVQSLQIYQQERSRRNPWRDDEMPWER